MLLAVIGAEQAAPEAAALRRGVPQTKLSSAPAVLADGERPKSWARRAGGRSSSAAARGEPALALRDARKGWRRGGCEGRRIAWVEPAAARVARRGLRLPLGPDVDFFGSAPLF